MKIRLLGQEVEVIEEAHQQVSVACGLFVARIHQYGACPSIYSHDWFLEARAIGSCARYGEGRTKSLEEAVVAVNNLAAKLSREMLDLAKPPQGGG